MKIIVSGGGTGGHIYPALTIADTIKKLYPDAEIRFVGTTHGLEKDLVPRAGYPIDFIDVQGFKRSLSADTFRSVYKLFTGLREAKKLLDTHKPDLVIGTGGYVCGPIVFLAAIKGIPACVQEQNALPGVTNKILSYFVKTIFLGYKEADKYFKGKATEDFYGQSDSGGDFKPYTLGSIAFFPAGCPKKDHPDYRRKPGCCVFKQSSVSVGKGAVRQRRCAGSACYREKSLRSI